MKLSSDASITIRPHRIWVSTSHFYEFLCETRSLVEVEEGFKLPRERRTRLRQRYKRGTSRISRSRTLPDFAAPCKSVPRSHGPRRCPSTAWKGRLQVRRAEKEEGWT